MATIWTSWLERTLSPRDGEEYAVRRSARARSYARILEEIPSEGCEAAPDAAPPVDDLCEAA